MIQPDFGFYPTYILDTCCVMELDNAHRVPGGRERPAPRYSDDERAVVWGGFKKLAEDGRLKIIRFVREELAVLYPSIVPKLESLPKARGNLTNQVRRIYQEIMARHPEIMEGWLRDPAYNDADPWIVAFAKTNGFIVVTEELSAGQSNSKKRKKGIQIPDLCAAESVKCIKLRDLAVKEGWLPSAS